MSEFFTGRLRISSLSTDDYADYQAYLLKNRDFLSMWEPKRAESWYSEQEIRSRIESQLSAAADDSGFSFVIRKKDEHEIIGTIALSNIVRGPFQSCFIGYGLSGGACNKGYMTEAVKAVVSYAFTVLKLHRIEGNCLPKNNASRRVLEKSGFAYEGTSPEYLKINGAWEDHQHYAVLNHEL